MFEQLPPAAVWRFVGAVDGFEVVFTGRHHLRGYTSAVENGVSYAVRYEIRFDDRWHTREAHVISDTVAGHHETILQSDGQGRWTVDGLQAPHLDGLIDVDLEASACTNALPVHRLEMPLNEVVASPAAYVRALDSTVSRLEQTYQRLDAHRYAYTSEDGTFHAVLRYDPTGLVLDYPGIATRFN
jgi:hypothetical protein